MPYTSRGGRCLRGREYLFGRVACLGLACSLTLLIACGAVWQLVCHEGTLHLRVATMRAAGGSSQLGAWAMCLLRTCELVVVISLCCAQRQAKRCSGSSSGSGSGSHGRAAGVGLPVSNSAVSLSSLGTCSNKRCCGGGVGGSCGSLPSLSSSTAALHTGSCAIDISACSATGVTGGGGLCGLCDAWTAGEHSPYDCGSPAALKSLRDETPFRMHSAAAISTLSVWVWLLLGSFAFLGAVCSWLVAFGGSGYLVQLLLGSGRITSRSRLGRALPVWLWLLYEVAAPASLLVAATSTLFIIPVELWRKRLSPQARSSTLRKEPLLSLQPCALCLHYGGLVISILELKLNDLPLLRAHLPLVVLFGSAHSLVLLLRLRGTGSFQYMHADQPRYSPVAAIVACCFTPTALAASFALLEHAWAARRAAA